MPETLHLPEPAFAAEAELETVLARQIGACFAGGRRGTWSEGRLATRSVLCGRPGGDFHQVLSARGECHTVLVGTVRGPGLLAALAKAVVCGAAQAVGPTVRSPADLLRHVQQLVEHLNYDLRNQRVFVSMFCAVVDGASKSLRFAAAGSIHAALRSEPAGSESLENDEVPLGVAGRGSYGVESRSLRSPIRLAICTDGLSRASTARLKTLGAAGAKRLLYQTLHLQPRAQVDAVLGAFGRPGLNRAALNEDITVVSADLGPLGWPQPMDSTAGARRWMVEGEQSADPSVYLG